MTLKLFEAFGIELEYMLVAPGSLDVRPMADSLLTLINGGAATSDVDSGVTSWSNELALHVLELKATEPTSDLIGLAANFQRAIADVQSHLSRCQLQFLPTAMHPLMCPKRSVVLWPHECYEIYNTFDQRFDCHTHGWGNVQSVHLNLPFSGDAEFAKLHAAIRLLLPILPALAASSPIVEGKATGSADSRLHHYVRHCRDMDCLVGQVIPDSVDCESEYDRVIYQPIRDAIERQGWTGTMRAEFMNARGAIARFDRGSIEIRVMDVQEQPASDVAICAAVIAILKSLVAEQWRSYEDQFNISTATLRQIFDQVVVCGGEAIIDSEAVLACFGIEETSMKASDLWRHLLHHARQMDATVDQLYQPLEVITRQGNLSNRIMTSLQGDISEDAILQTYAQLANCLASGKSFQP
ncbi:glutamate-cysteine ligase family protein [Stieleria sp. JC731]|uniref:glutamate-cysteine ligase family protein n=1 Tax=Pirellulaceae TaxID=2691357 RepID=UPI001E29D415|nr:glutamate-cysteine ligase family protein [Stieleria sp. JC731]MCC9602180.1 glutamate-cysteine ligase family protein [Stieleria sp. JC731]